MAGVGSDENMLRGGLVQEAPHDGTRLNAYRLRHGMYGGTTLTETLSSAHVAYFCAAANGAFYPPTGVIYA
jgi:hypothetical protein